MLFNTIPFLIFLPLVFFGYWILKPNHRNVFLLIASYYFYFSYNPWFLILLIGTSALDYYLAKLISRTDLIRKRKCLLLVSLISNIGLLFVFKYFVFFYNSSLQLFSPYSLLLTQLIIPAGLSFYTFQSISYTIDVFRNKYKATDSLQDFLLFVSFFPHMVAGPIMRHDDLMPQLKVTHHFKTIDWEAFAKLTIWGFFKKMVIADNLALIVDPAFDNLNLHFNSVEFVLIGFLFLIQLYADFSGYSDIAMGVAKLFKINLMLNWKRPLLATSITDYWQRHHISLTNWFKEYVYFSLGGNKVKAARWIFNILIVFLLSALWHGSNFTFMVWGLLNGVFYVIEKGIRNLKFNTPILIKRIYTLCFISIFFIAFRVSTMQDLSHIYRTIFLEFSFKGGFTHFFSLDNHMFFFMIFLFLIILFFKEIYDEFQFVSVGQYLKNWSSPSFYFIVLFLIFAFGNFNANSFIYFQF
ncbi:MAG: MBOAT family O-acyltransferase [Bacteroidota bacterium]|jgi:D-alanyl-lipoteichoic acid acyltransferase DltB (MBOAT superfamily)